MRPHNNKLIGLACGRASSDCGERLLARDSFARDSLLATPCSQPPCCHHVLAIYSSFVPSQPPPPPSFARKASCTKAKPCTPCEIDHMIPFGDRWTRCQSCSADVSEKCNFVPEVGPYCFKSVTSREVGPCKKCCTDGAPVFDDEGVCH